MTLDRHNPFRAVFRTDPYGWTRFKNEARGFGVVGALHKGPIESAPFRFANELICGNLAQFLRLPIPPFAVTYCDQREGEDSHKGNLFSSVDFNYERDSLPLADFDLCVEHLAPQCAGVLMFDILIANPDRSKDNIWCDRVDRPTRLLIYDHDQALLGGENEGLDRLAEFKDKLGLRHMIDVADYHPFLARITESTDFDEWYNRANSIPRWFLKDICDEATKFEISKADAKKIESFLNYRCRHLEEIVAKNKHRFSSVRQWGQGLFQ